MFDMILSIVIIVVSLGIVFSYFTTTNENVDIYSYNYQILSGFTQTKINTLNNEEVRKMFIDNKIKNIDNTVAQQVAEFYHTENIVYTENYAENISYAENLTRIFVEDYVNKQMSFRVSISNSTEPLNFTVLFEDVKNDLNSTEDGTISSVTQRTIFGFIDKDTVYSDVIKIEIWM